MEKETLQQLKIITKGAASHLKLGTKKYLTVQPLFNNAFHNLK